MLPSCFLRSDPSHNIWSWSGTRGHNPVAVWTQMCPGPHVKGRRLSWCPWPLQFHNKSKVFLGFSVSPHNDLCFFQMCKRLIDLFSPSWLWSLSISHSPTHTQQHTHTHNNVIGHICEQHNLVLMNTNYVNDYLHIELWKWYPITSGHRRHIKDILLPGMDELTAVHLIRSLRKDVNTRSE